MVWVAASNATTADSHATAISVLGFTAGAATLESAPIEFRVAEQTSEAGLGDLQIGNQPDFLKPNRDGPRLKSIPDAAQKAIAAAVITLASRGDFRREVTFKGARRLGIKQAELINFRKALMARRIKSPTANHVYDWCIGNCPEDEDRRIVINYLLSLIDKQEV